MIPRWLAPLLALTALVSLWPLSRRHQAETRNRATAVAAEYDTVEALAAGQGIPVPEALKRLREKGLTAVVVGEETVGEMISVGRLEVVTISGPGGKGEPRIVTPALRVNDLSILPRLSRRLTERFGDLAGPLDVRSGVVSLPPVDTLLVRQTSLGLDPGQVADVRKAGLLLVGRVGNPPGASERYVRATIASLAEAGAFAFLPQGDSVLGRKDALPVALDELRKRGLLYASPEFAKIAGDANAVDAVPDLVVRTHTAQAAELDRMGEEAAVDRFVKAGRERGMRLLLLRPLTLAAAQPLDAFAEFVGRVADGARENGLVAEKPHGFTDPALPRPANVLLGLLGAGVTFGAVVGLTRRPGVRRIAGAVLLLIGLAGVTKVGLSVVSLLVAMATPVIGFLLLDDRRPGERLPDPWRALPGALLVSAVSLAGGLFVAATMTGLPYFVRAEEFRGVKLAVFAPVLGVGVLFLSRLTDLKGTLRGAVTWGASLTGLGLVVVLAVLNARTGNDGGVGASDGELAFRGVLDQVLYVRPRTKEFLIGHPALVVAVGMLLATRAGRLKSPGYAGWTALLLAGAAIGQTGIVNTFCHGHIPLGLSLARVGIGFVLGSILGVAIWSLLAPRLTRARGENE